MRQHITLTAPLAMELTGTGTGKDSRYEIHATLLNPNLNAHTAAFFATITGPDGQDTVETVPPSSPGHWRVTLDAARTGEGVYEVKLRLEAP